MNTLICGATTYGNVGDDAIRNIIAQHLTSLKTIVKTTRPHPQKELIQWADKVVIGGGGILYDGGGVSHGQSNFNYYVRDFLTYSLELNKPVCLCGVGIQKFEVKENIDYLRECLSKVSFVSVRQEEDKVFFEKNELLKTKIIVADDLAFRIPKASFTFTAASKKTKVCIIPNNNVNFKYFAWLVEELKKEDYEIYVTTTSYEDLPLVEKLRQLIGECGSVRDYKYLTASELVAFLGEMNVVLSARFHGLVFAYTGGCRKILTLSPKSKLTNQLRTEGHLYHLLKTKDFNSIKSALSNDVCHLKFNNSSINHLTHLTNFINE